MTAEPKNEDDNDEMEIDTDESMEEMESDVGHILLSLHLAYAPTSFFLMR